jgi:beta-galactosidase
MPKLTYNEKDFLMDGKPYKIMSGAMHYFRIPREYWRERLLKLKECGLNTLETYIAWNMHEPEEGVYEFDGNLDVSAYLDICEELGLNVIIRPGPYICAEWEFGGFPWWLLKYENITLRAYDEVYLSKVKRFYTRLFEELRPHLVSNGGSIIMLQIENEYGSYGDDKRYMRAIAELYREQKMDCLYFTSDGLEGWMMTGGPLDEHLAVANFGSRPYEQLTRLRGYRPNQPAMCGEYWCGWFDHWFEEHHTRDPKALAADFEEFFKVDGSFSIYMFHGGTNFGFMNGANYQDVYAPTVTSYDYFAPLNEAGDRTEFYYHIRDIIGKYFGKETLPELTAKDSEKRAYGKVKLTNQALLLENLDFTEREAQKNTDVISQTLLYLNDNFKNNVSLGVAATQLGYNPSYLSRTFKESMGITFNAYLTMLRLREAVQLLKNGESVSFCVSESGFNSIRTFYRAFQNEFGCTPKEYVKNQVL